MPEASYALGRVFGITPRRMSPINRLLGQARRIKPAAVAVDRDEVIGSGWSPGASVVGVWPTTGLPLAEEGIDDLPRPHDLAWPRKLHLLPFQDLAQDVVVGIRHPLPRHRPVIEAQGSRHELELGPRMLRPDAQENAFVRLNAKHDNGGNRVEGRITDAEAGSVLEPNHHLGDIPRQRLASPKEDRHTLPAPVFYGYACGGVGFAP